MTSQKNIISSLAHLAALRMQTTKLANDAQAIAQQIEKIEKDITSVFVASDAAEHGKTKTNKKRSADQMSVDQTLAPTAPIAQQKPASVPAAVCDTTSSFFGGMLTLPQGQTAAPTPTKPKVPKIYPGYPKNCEFCNNYLLKTPRSKSGHERKCPGKPKAPKDEAALATLTSPAPQSVQMQPSIAQVSYEPQASLRQEDSLPKKTVGQQKQPFPFDFFCQQDDAPIADKRQNVATVKAKRVFERAIELCDDERDEEDDFDEDDEAGSLDEFVAADDEVEYFDDSEEGAEDAEAEDEDMEQQENGKEKTTSNEQNPKKKPRLLIRRSKKIIADESMSEE